MNKKLRALADYVLIADGILDDDTCDELIAKFENSDLKKTEGSWHTDYRSFDELNISHDERFTEVQELLYGKTKDMVELYKKATHSEYLPERYGLEELRMKRYQNDGNDQFGWHTDVGDYDSARRFLVVFYYLNDVEEGGETLFEERDGFVMRVKPKRGRVVMFPPMWMFPHKGEQPKSGNKYIISTYGHYL